VRQQTAELNPVALASFVLAIIGFVGLLPVVSPALAIVLGEVAKRQIARTGQAGLGIARGVCGDAAPQDHLPLGTTRREEVAIERLPPPSRNHLISERPRGTLGSN
jgi:hypothetical protein